MIFPELTGRIADRLKSAFAGFGSPEPLSLKGANFSFGLDPATLKDARMFPQLYSILGSGMPAVSGEIVSTATALNHSVVWACNRLICETLAMIPLAMMQRSGNATRVADEKPAYRLLHDAPNAEMTAMTLRESATSHCCLGGGGFAHIRRRSGTGVAIGLDLLLPPQVYTTREKTGQKRLVYEVKSGSDPAKTYTVQEGKAQDILHLRGIGWDGVNGYSIITMGRQSIGTAIAAEHHVGKFYANGGRKPYNLKLDKKFENNAAFEQFRADWMRIYSNPHEVPIIEPWFDYNEIGMSMVECQMLETRLFDIHEICRWFRVSPHLVGDLSRATFSNIEQLALEFEKFTLSAWYKRWEQELWRCLLTPEEQAQGYFFKHNSNALQRGDFESRMKAYAMMLQNGVASVNEVRDLEDWNPVEGGDDHHIQLNMQSLPGGEPLTSQAAQLVRLGAS